MKGKETHISENCRDWNQSLWLSRLRWFGHVEPHKEDANWARCCMTMEVDWLRQRSRPRKSWWDSDCVKIDIDEFDPDARGCTDK